MSIWRRFTESVELNCRNEDALLSELYRQMLIVACSRSRSRTDALDIVQESWVKILLHINTLKEPGKLFHWAKVIVVNTSINAYKRKYVNTVELFEGRMNAGDSDFDRVLELKEQCRIVRVGLEQLDAETRKIIIYKFYYGLKDTEIAAIMRMPVGTVKARIHRAKPKLKKSIVEEWDTNIIECYT
jgi:RNA polymerase sigma-70 factor (ECF subfamily)